MSYELENIIPKFIRTSHLPFEPNASRDDLVADISFIKQLILEGERASVEEKLDGANCGITIVDGLPIIRNRNHILSQAQSGRLKTPAKLQFDNIWNWFYSNVNKFEKLTDLLGFVPSVYGEWMYATHSVKYDLLPDFFVPFDIYDYRKKIFLSPDVARSCLKNAGFSLSFQFSNDSMTTKTLFSNEKLLYKMRDGKSIFSSNSQREGIYIKVYDEEKILNRFKMVRSGFITDDHWNKKLLRKNVINN